LFLPLLHSSTRVLKEVVIKNFGSRDIMFPDGIIAGFVEGVYREICQDQLVR